MYRPSEGMRRLGIVVGGVAILGWIIIIMVGTNGFTRITLLEWVIFLIGIPICFGLGFGLIWAIDWVVSGFREGRK
jgi:hypothetical protein